MFASDLAPTDSVKEFSSIPEITSPNDLATFQLETHNLYRTVRFSIGRTVVVSTTHIDDLKKYAKLPEKPRPLYEFLQAFMPSIVSHNTKEILQRRQYEQRYLTAEKVKENISVLNKIIDMEIDTWLIAAGRQGGVISIQKKLKTLAMRMAINLICGIDCPQSERLAEAFHNIVSRSMKLQESADAELQRQVDEDIRYVRDTVATFFEARRNSQSRGLGSTVFIDELITDKDRSAAEACDWVVSVILAGYHTVAATCSWTLYLLAQHPQIAKNAGDHSSYLQKVIYESMRRYTPGPFTVREMNCHGVVDGYHVPKGTCLFYPLWAVHMDKDYWKNPTEFNPEREFNRLAFFAFGSGKRACTGQTAAEAEIPLILTKVLKKITLAPVSGFKPTPCNNFVLISGNELQIKIKPRSTEIHARHWIMLGAMMLLTLLFQVKLHRPNKERFIAQGLLLLGTGLFVALRKRNNYSFFQPNNPKQENTSVDIVKHRVANSSTG